MIIYGLRTRRKRFEPVPAGKWAKLPAPEAIIEGILRRGALAFLYGKDGAGKSFVALDMGFCVCLGLPWAGRVVHPTPTLYIAAEDGFGIGERITAWRKAHPDADPDQLLIVDEAVNLYEPQTGRKEPTLPADLKSAIEEWDKLEQPPGLVIVDTLARSTIGADESSNSDMALVVASVEELQRRYNCAVILIHHTGKDQAKGLRGASALHAAADTALRVRRNAKGTTFFIECSKVRHFKPFEPIKGELLPVQLGGGHSSCVVMWDEPDTEEEQQGIDANVAKLWPLLSASEAVTFLSLTKQTGLSNSSLGRALKRMSDKGLIGKTTDGYIRHVAYDGIELDDALKRAGLRA